MNSLETAENPVDFNVVKQLHVVNQKLLFLFTLKNPSMNKQRVSIFAEVVSQNRWMSTNQRIN